MYELKEYLEGTVVEQLIPDAARILHCFNHFNNPTNQPSMPGTEYCSRLFRILSVHL